MVYELAVFGGGCFWCTEAIFSRLRGVVDVQPGYAGGAVDHPNYDQVSMGTTGHAEVISITFDPSVISYSELLDVFFATHDPTTLNRQGADVGTQYRSVIFPTTKEQEIDAVRKIKTLSSHFRDPIVTTIEVYTQVFPAEDYHKNYFSTHPDAGYCRIVIAPKIAKLMEQFGEKVKETISV